MPSAVRIPTTHHKSLRDLVTMAPELRKRFVDAIRSATAVLDADDLIVHVSRETGVERESTADIIRMLLSMYRASEVSRELFAAEVVEAAKDILKDEDSGAIDWASVATDLSAALQCHDSLGVTAKVFDLRREYATVFCSARILTDIRPVFAVDPQKAPLAAAVIHTLRISYHQGNEHRDFHVALDTTDLRQLRQLVERAFKKETSLRAVIEKTGMQYLDVEDD